LSTLLRAYTSNKFLRILLEINLFISVNIPVYVNVIFSVSIVYIICYWAIYTWNI